MSNPVIQVDNVVREMTDEEHASYLETIKDAPILSGTDNDD